MKRNEGKRNETKWNEKNKNKKRNQVAKSMNPTKREARAERR